MGNPPSLLPAKRGGAFRFFRLVSVGLALFSCLHPSHAQEDDRLDFKYMYYGDKNGVWNHTPAFTFLKALSFRWKFQWNQEFDAVSGASRRLGMRNVGRQGDHDLVLDGITGASKREIRHSEQAGISFADKGRQGSASFYYSDESDYTSYSPSVSGSWDFNQRNTTLGGALSVFFDNLHPQGAFSGLGGDRTLISGTLSLTQIVSPTTLVSMTANSIRSSGALGHPYNPVVLADGALLIESLPAGKTSYALAGQIIQGYAWGDRRGSVHLDARYYRDTWYLSSQTGEVQVYQYYSDQGYLRLRSRLYRQTPAAFAKEGYAGNEVYRTADIRYFGFSSLTLGLKWASVFPDGWAEKAWLPDRWDIAYDHGMRDTRGDEGGPGPFTHYQLFPKSEFYAQGVFMLGIGFDL